MHRILHPERSGAHESDQTADTVSFPDIGSTHQVRRRGLLVVSGCGCISPAGRGLKVAKCIDLFSLGRLNAVPVDTWVRKMAADWYGVEGTDARICAWAENRGGRHAGYWGEYLFAHYRELNAPSLDDRVLSFAASDASSSILPFERRGCEG